MTIYAGETVRISAAVTDPSNANAPLDAATITLRAKDGSTSAVTTYTGGVHDGTGLYHFDVPVPNGGQWTYRIEAVIGTATAVWEGTFAVKHSDVS